MAQTLLSVLLAQSATPATLSPAPCASCWPNRGRSGVMHPQPQLANLKLPAGTQDLGWLPSSPSFFRKDFRNNVQKTSGVIRAAAISCTCCWRRPQSFHAISECERASAVSAWERRQGEWGCQQTDIKKDCRPRKDTVTHSFLVMPECPYPLCRCDLLQKLFRLPPYPLRGTEREFLEAVGYYNLWIPGLIEIAKPLDSIEQWAFEELKKALISAPALALPDVTKPFHLHVSEVRSIAKGVLIQTLDPWKRPVAYLSKRLDPVVAGWPACLRAVATTALLVKEADK
ncbi:hypothetical protein QTO34_001388 [Cnephaeus nilssonii]|uniref:Reverse transcriptase/retrotransposon-derived protein RNase H-like domain-containing protein n=1 Tax=Cnephaeus nilssonii TaxID=3371016 RepID=A0AA40HW04_CNENI|nr:hypothetical protein QTO34_001388 [Eptesicus nilssonii]